MLLLGLLSIYILSGLNTRVFPQLCKSYFCISSNGFIFLLHLVLLLLAYLSRKKLDSLLAEFSIAHIRQASAISLSGGERRRVEIARCLASQPKYILLDEPFAGVDPIAVNEIRSLVSHLRNRDIGILITDHNVRETLEIIDRAYILHDGNVLMSGTPEEVVQDTTVRHVYLGDNYRA